MAHVLSAGIIVADHVCAPISHLPAAGELVMTDQMLLTLGGCAANVAVDLVKMKVSTAVVGRVGSDVFGRVVADMLRASGVATDGITISPTADTSQTLIVNVTGQDRRFVHTFGANGEFAAADIPLSRYPDCKVLYLGGLFLMPRLVPDELVPVFAGARRQGIKTVLDVVTPGPDDYLPKLARLLPEVDVFLPNNHEAELILGEGDPLKAAERFHALGVKTAVVTCGGDGAYLVNNSVKLKSGVFAVPFVDGTGGGDAFDAGFIFGLLQAYDPENCLRIASALGASCVRASGATPGVFTRAECEAFLLANQLSIQRI